MANQFALNTTAYPTLYNLVFNTRDGLFDYRAQMSAGKVTVAGTKPMLLKKAREIAPNPGQPKYLIET